MHARGGACCRAVQLRWGGVTRLYFLQRCRRAIRRAAAAQDGTPTGATTPWPVHTTRPSMPAHFRTGAERDSVCRPCGDAGLGPATVRRSSVDEGNIRRVRKVGEDGRGSLPPPTEPGNQRLRQVIPEAAIQGGLRVARPAKRAAVEAINGRRKPLKSSIDPERGAPPVESPPPRPASRCAPSSAVSPPSCVP